MGRSRRNVLLNVAALAVASQAASACGVLANTEASSPDPLAEFYANTVALAAIYDRAVPVNPELAPIRDAHRAHAAALAAIIKPAPPSSAPVVPDGLGPADRKAAEQHGFTEALQLALLVPAERATLLGEIAAARACHLEVLP